MPRTARLSYPGGVFHLISRCVGGQFLIRDDEDRAYYLDLLGRTLKGTDATMLAWCLMSSHVHLVVIQGVEPLARLTKPLHTGFAARVNKRRRGRGARGPVFSQRPRTLLVQEDAYLLELVRYIHNNPVRAGLTRRASQSPWSSHRAYIGKAEPPDWLPVGYLLDQFGRRSTTARRLFDEFVRETQAEARNAELSGDAQTAAQAIVTHELGDGWRSSDGILGDARFVALVRKDTNKAERALQSGRLVGKAPKVPGGDVAVREVVEAVLVELGIEPWKMEARPRTRAHVFAHRLMAWVWTRRCGGQQVALARELRVGTSQVSRWYAAAVAAAPEIEPLADKIVQHVAARRRSRRKPLPPATSKFAFQVVIEE